MRNCVVKGGVKGSHCGGPYICSGVQPRCQRQACGRWPATSRVPENMARVIEFMDVGATNGWKMDDVIPGAEVVKRIHEVFPCEPVDPNYSGEVARRWRYQNGGRVRLHLQRCGGLLRRLHPRATFHRWRDLRLPVRSEGL